MGFALEKPAEAVGADWAWQRGQARWRSVWSTGMIGSWIDYYNKSRPHSALAGRTPEEVYTGRAAPSPGHAPEMTQEALAA